MIDPNIPWLAEAQEAALVERQLEPILGTVELRQAQLLRHKPSKRALLRYDIYTTNGPRVLLGKIRAKGLDSVGWAIHHALWQEGFSEDSPDGLCVSPPIGVVPNWHMVLQGFVPGQTATPQTDPLRIADLIHKLHTSRLRPQRTHTPADELRVLEHQLTPLKQQYPAIESILRACQTLVVSLKARPLYPIHRDFYPDQVLCGGPRLYLLDLDLCCWGDPALDMGNYLAHLCEQALRETGQPDTYQAQEQALLERFCHHWSHDSAAVQTYRLLSLVRHIAISQRIPQRRNLTEQLVELCGLILRGGPTPAGL